MRYVPYEEIGERPCIVVDGTPHPAARIVLSHWPQSGTPAELEDDLSAQIVLHYLGRPDLRVDADIASNDHFDEDGLASLWAILHPDEALARRELLTAFAAAGDFGTYRARGPARSAFIISALADPARSPLPGDLFERPFAERVAGLYSELLGYLPEILDHPERYRELWREEDRILDASEEALRKGDIQIEEVPELDLAIVTLRETATPVHVHRYAQARERDYHPMAIYNATGCNRVLYVKGRRYELEFRYESWVKLISVRPLPRVDLTPLAEQLSAEEKAPARWVFEGVGAIDPRLHLVGAGESRIAPERFRAEVERFLATAPPAWDPYAEGDHA